MSQSVENPDQPATKQFRGNGIERGWISRQTRQAAPSSSGDLTNFRSWHAIGERQRKYPSVRKLFMGFMLIDVPEGGPLKSGCSSDAAGEPRSSVACLACRY